MYKFMTTVLLGLVFTSCHKEDFAKPGALVPLTVDQDPSLPSLQINGTLLHVESHGKPSDPLLIMIHGGPGGDYRSMLEAKAFADDGFHVVFYDQRGSGLSKREPKSQYQGKGAVQLFIDDLHAVIAHFKSTDSQKVFLMGHSWGAMLATAYINQNPDRISGVVLAEPGGFTWPQTLEYLGRSNKIKFFSEALNNATFPEQFIAGRPEHEVLDYKALFFSSYETAPGNTIGNAGPYPYWRSGALAFKTLIENVDIHSFDFTTRLHEYSPHVLLMYSEYNKAYGASWAEKVVAPFPHADIQMVKNTGHEILYFGWTDFYPKALAYLNQHK